MSVGENYTPTGATNSGVTRYTSAEAATGTQGAQDRTTMTLLADRMRFLADTGLIAFPATQVTSSDPNTQDDYEEGNYTATIVCSTSGTVTVDSSNNTLQYRKIGSLVVVSGQISISAVSSPLGVARISLPFTSGAGTQSSGRSAGSIIPIGALSGFVGAPMLLLLPSVATMELYEFGAGTIAGAAARLTTNTALSLCIAYSV